MQNYTYLSQNDKDFTYGDVGLHKFNLHLKQYTSEMFLTFLIHNNKLITTEKLRKTNAHMNCKPTQII